MTRLGPGDLVNSFRAIGQIWFGRLGWGDPNRRVARIELSKSPEPSRVARTEPSHQVEAFTKYLFPQIFVVCCSEFRDAHINMFHLLLTEFADAEFRSSSSSSSSPNKDIEQIKIVRHSRATVGFRRLVRLNFSANTLPTKQTNPFLLKLV